MRVLVACEFSGIVRDAFVALGHSAWSCDLIASERPGRHLRCDIRDVLDSYWDLMIAHPPCTYLACSGARWWKGREREQAEALDFVRLLLAAPIDRIALENPPGAIGSHRVAYPLRRPIHPALGAWPRGDEAHRPLAEEPTTPTPLTDSSRARHAHSSRIAERSAVAESESHVPRDRPRDGRPVGALR